MLHRATGVSEFFSGEVQWKKWPTVTVPTRGLRGPNILHLTQSMADTHHGVWPPERGRVKRQTQNHFQRLFLKTGDGRGASHPRPDPKWIYVRIPDPKGVFTPPTEVVGWGFPQPTSVSRGIEPHDWEDHIVPKPPRG